MKKIYLSALLINITFSGVLSQGISGGIRGGMNISNQSFTTSPPPGTSSNSIFGLIAGVYVTLAISENFGIQPELVFSQMGYSANGMVNIAPPNLPANSLNFKSVVNINYLCLPILLRYNFTKNFSLQAGPQLGYLLSAKASAEISPVPTGFPGSSTLDIKDQINTIEFGAVFGLGADFGKFNAGARYNLGFSNLNKNVAAGTSDKTTNNAIQILVGYKLFGK